jgi:predicted DNA-binding transcriptional regulator AlpA
MTYPPLLNYDDIAARIGESRSYVRDTLVRRADFPRPALALSQKIRKWAASDVEAWLDKQKAKWSK